MAQPASSAQREPSMDEILASIRRIIEESEPERRASVDLSAIEQLATGAPIGQAANDVAARSEQPQKARPELLTMDALDAIAPRPEGVVPHGPVEAEQAYSEASALFDEDLETAFQSLDDVHPEVEALDISALDELDLPADEPLAVEPEQPEILASVLTAAMAAPASVKPILSANAGRQVAASFGDLAEAFAVNRNRRLDEVAEEMLRPMLQDWLDNNLPVMVERLVREEIERVARGG